MRTYGGIPEILQDLAASRIDVFVTDKLVGLYAAMERASAGPPTPDAPWGLVYVLKRWLGLSLLVSRRARVAAVAHGGLNGAVFVDRRLHDGAPRRRRPRCSTIS